MLHPSLRWRSIAALLDERAAATPGAPAAAFPGAELSYAQLAEASVAAARRLHSAGVRPGDRVGILLREGSEAYLALALGAMRLGAIFIGVNARYKVRELEFVLGHAGVRLLLSSEDFGPTVEQVAVPEGCDVVMVGADPGFEAGLERTSVAEVAALEAGVGRDDPALLLYTSGTTADPKGCVHPQATLLAVGENCAGRLGMTAEDRFWTPLPLFHVGGWQTFMSALSRGACFSHAGAFEADRALEQLERERVTVAFPAFELIWTAVLNHPRYAAADLGALRLVINVGVPERMEEMQARVPQATQVSCFGMTESCGSICIGDPADSPWSRSHTSGRPLPGVEIRVVDPGSGAEVADREHGELLFRGITRFSGYYADEAATTAAVDEEGWVRTGDLVCRWEDGAISFVSRGKDMLKVGGENVSAADIEGYLISHPAVEIASVVGVSDARYGEVPAAFVRLAPGEEASEEELIEFCLGQIATYKVPRYVRMVEEFPATPTEKIQKFVLRERIEAELRERGITEAPKLGPARQLGT